MINSMGEYLNLMKVANEFISKTKEADTTMFFSLIGTIIDQWCADHGIDSDETISMTKALADAQKEVHKTIGPAKPGNEIGF